MGGIAAGYSDFQSVNFVNPATYGNLTSTIFDIGLETDTRTLKSLRPVSKFSSAYTIISYLQLGLPIKMKKANRKDIFWGMNIGLRPVSRINYKISKQERLAGIDSLGKIYEGTGGLSQAYLGTGLRIKNFSIGVNGGYMFGNKDYSTRLTFLNDTVKYAQSNTESKTNFGGLFLNGGIQYDIHLKNNKSLLRLGAYGGLKQNLNANKDVVIETVQYDASGAKFRVDSVFDNHQKGTVQYPNTFGVGFTYLQPHWVIGADYEATSWQNYRFYDQPDLVQNNWKIRAGTEYFPADINTPIKKYFNFVRYRFGFYYGSDYVKIDNSKPEYGITLGAGFPLKLRRGYYESQSSVLNTAIEIGSRGNRQSNLRENIVRISVGLSLSDLWFGRAKYQ